MQTIIIIAHGSGEKLMRKIVKRVATPLKSELDKPLKYLQRMRHREKRQWHLSLGED